MVNGLLCCDPEVLVHLHQTKHFIFLAMPGVCESVCVSIYVCLCVGAMCMCKYMSMCVCVCVREREREREQGERDRERERERERLHSVDSLTAEPVQPAPHWTD